MSKLEVRFEYPTPEHLAHVARHMREADREEVRASGYDDIEQALKDSLALSTHASAWIINGTVGVVMGVAPMSLINGVGSPWMLGTNHITRNPRALIECSQPYIQAMLRVYPRLENHVHAANKTAVAWLQREGFTMHPPAPHGPRGELFHKFEMKA